jgi:hypothetical protein
MSEPNYKEVSKAAAEFAALQKKYAEIICHCWAVYIIKKEFTDGGNPYGHRYEFALDTETEEMAYAAANAMSKSFTVFVLPVRKTGIGRILSESPVSKDMTHHFYEYDGPCKMRIGKSDFEPGVPPSEEWFEVLELSDIGGCANRAIAYVNGTIPDIWKGLKYGLVSKNIDIQWAE